MDYIANEPVRFWGLVTSLIAAVIALLQIFGVVTMTGDQIAAIMFVIAALGGLFQFFFVRNKVTPVA